MSVDQRSQIKSDYDAAGIKIIVSLGGGQDWPTTNNVDPTVFANAAATFVTQYGLDGVDVDYEVSDDIYIYNPLIFIARMMLPSTKVTDQLRTG